MANFLVQADFAGGVDPNRSVALGSLQDDDITFPTELRDNNGNVIQPSVDGSQFEILLLDGADTLDGSGLEPGRRRLIVIGNLGNDNITGSADSDTLFGGQDGDLIFGGDGNDEIFGNLGNDPTLAGGDGNDLIFGGQGNDDVRGADGNDQVFGDRGNDTVSGGNGTDTLTGGSGQDQFIIDPRVENSTVDPAFVDQVADFSTVDGETIILPQQDAFGIPIGPASISISPLQPVGGNQGFVIAENGVDINADGNLFAPIAFVVSNANITRPLDAAVDFQFTLA